LEAELDELWSFVGKKANRQWVWIAMDAAMRQIVAFHVGDRSRQSAEALWQKIPTVYRVQATFYTDHYAVKGNWHLDQSMQSKIIAMAFSMAAEIERELISQRTMEALRFRKAQGMQLGRPRGPGKSKLDPYRPEIEGLLANGATQRFVARRYKTTEANLHHWLKKHGFKT
jgi:IS1 family transposase